MPWNIAFSLEPLIAMPNKKCWKKLHVPRQNIFLCCFVMLAVNFALSTVIPQKRSRSLSSMVLGLVRWMKSCLISSLSKYCVFFNMLLAEVRKLHLLLSSFEKLSFFLALKIYFIFIFLIIVTNNRNFKDKAKHKPINFLLTVYSGHATLVQ